LAIDLHFRQFGLRHFAQRIADTKIELRVIAALAMIGLSRSPDAGWSTPAAIGTERVLNMGTQTGSAGYFVQEASYARITAEAPSIIAPVKTSLETNGY